MKAWYFSVYEGIELIEIFRLKPAKLEADFFSQWEAKWNASGKDINNQKIPVQFVREHGELVYARSREGKEVFANPIAAPPRARPKKK